jgi:hypothetical protein
MNIKEFREILTIIAKLDPKEAQVLFDQASNREVSDEELGKSLEARISKANLPTSILSGLSGIGGSGGIVV